MPLYSFGRVTEEIASGIRKVYTYDSGDRVTSLKVYQGSVLEMDLAYEYDAAGQLTAVVSDGIRTTCAYDAAGRLAQEIPPGGAGDGIASVLLTGTKPSVIIFFDLKKASKRTPSGKDTRERPPLAASGFCLNRNRPPPWSRPPKESFLRRPGRDLPLQRTRATAFCRKQGGTVEYEFVSHP